MALRVFVIEDSKAMQSAIEVMLESIGGLELVAVASSEMQATEWLHTNGPAWDIAIVDLMLDSGSGFHLIPRLRQTHGEGHLAVASHFATNGVAEKCVLLGADAVFSKSHPSEFAEHLASLVKARSAHGGPLPG